MHDQTRTLLRAGYATTDTAVTPYTRNFAIL
jgi:hypothetical protein